MIAADEAPGAHKRLDAVLDAHADTIGSASDPPNTWERLRVTDVEPLEDYTVRPRFDDDSERVVDLSDALWGPMGEPLRDPEHFRLIRVDPELRTVVWPNGFDLDPDVLHGDDEPAPHADPTRAA